MSLDATLSSIAQSLSRIAAALEAQSTVAPASAPVYVAAAPVSSGQFVQQVPAPVQQQPVQQATQFSQPVTVNPAAQQFQQPVTTGNPFGKDAQGGEQTLTGYVMDAYRSMGPIKGGKINDILIAMGCKNINEVQPVQYAQFHGAVEALKVSA